MTEDPIRTPKKLREMAEHCTRLAHGISDPRTADALEAYSHELLEEAARLEREEHQPDA
jgi:hypothetical protein